MYSFNSSSSKQLEHKEMSGVSQHFQFKPRNVIINIVNGAKLQSGQPKQRMMD